MARKHLLLHFFIHFLIASVALSLERANEQITIKAADQLDPPFRREPFPICRSCPSIAELRQPSFGIALELNYGTIFARQHNGSSQTIAKVDGGQEYVETMTALAGNSAPRMPYGGMQPYWDLYEYRKQYLLRKINKLLGRPANGRTRVLASMINDLCQKVAPTKVTLAAVSSPDHIRFHIDEITNILDYLSIKNVMYDDRETYRYIWSDLFASKAAFAGSGAGLCKSYFDARACEIEEYYLPEETTIQLDFSSVSLVGAIDSRKAYHNPTKALTYVNTTLGANAQHAENYWLDVKSSIRQFVQSSDRHITNLVLTGEPASNPIFRQMVKEALRDLVAVHILHNLDEAAVNAFTYGDADPLWLTAKGAAEIAERRIGGPFMCRDTPECKIRRAGERQNVVEKHQLTYGTHLDL